MNQEQKQLHGRIHGPSDCKVVVMKIQQLFVILILGFILAIPASAEFYRYVDKHGNVLFTDDLSKVPPDQREQVKSYEESRSIKAPVSREDTAERPSDGDKAEAAENDEKERQRLLEQEKALSQEYEELMNQRAELNKEKEEAVTNNQIKDYNRKIVEFNARIKAYEEKRDALAAEAKAFNERIGANEPQNAQSQ